MKDLAGFDRTEVCAGQRDDCDSPTLAGNELHLIRIVAMTVDDGSDIAGLETVAWNLPTENDCI